MSTSTQVRSDGEASVADDMPSRAGCSDARVVTQSISRITNCFNSARCNCSVHALRQSPDEGQVHGRFDLARPAARYGAGIKSAKLFASHERGLVGRQAHGRPGRLVPLPLFSSSTGAVAGCSGATKMAALPRWRSVRAPWTFWAPWSSARETSSRGTRSSPPPGRRRWSKTIILTCRLPRFAGPSTTAPLRTSCIQTVPRRGYRFITPVLRDRRPAASVAQLADAPEPDPAGHRPDPNSRSRYQLRGPVIAWAAGALICSPSRPQPGM